MTELNCAKRDRIAERLKEARKLARLCRATSPRC